MVPKPPVQPRGTRHDRRLDSHHDRPHRFRRGESRALAPDHLGFRGLRPLPEADRKADSRGHPRTPRVATRRFVLEVFTAAVSTAAWVFSSRRVRGSQLSLNKGKKRKGWGGLPLVPPTPPLALQSRLFRILTVLLRA